MSMSRHVSNMDSCGNCMCGLVKVLYGRMKNVMQCVPGSAIECMFSHEMFATCTGYAVLCS